MLGGDTSVGPATLRRAWVALRQAIRRRQPELELGGWVNPHKNPRLQVEYLLESTATADFFLTQVVSHHDLGALESFLYEARRQDLTVPGTVRDLLLPERQPSDPRYPGSVPAGSPPGLTEDFAGGATAPEVCGLTVRALWNLGIHNIYISNLPVYGAPAVLKEVLRLAADAEPA